MSDIRTALKRPARSPQEQETLVKAVVAAQPGEPETDFIEWKCGLSLSDKKGAFAVARTILALANRHPDDAGRVARGCGYMVVGAEPGRLCGTDKLDSADVDNKLSVYLGSRGPSWSMA